VKVRADIPSGLDGSGKVSQQAKAVPGSMVQCHVGLLACSGLEFVGKAC